MTRRVLMHMVLLLFTLAACPPAAATDAAPASPTIPPTETLLPTDPSIASLARVGRRLTWTLFAAQSLGSAAFIAAATLASILGAELSGSRALAGIPSAVYMAGTAGAALAWGYLMESLGRRGGLVLGLAIGAFGAALAYGAINAGSFVVFLAGLVLMGVASAALTLGRFASAEVHPPAERGRAISTVVLGGTVGAVLGPLLVGPAGAWAEALGHRDLSGAYHLVIKATVGSDLKKRKVLPALPAPDAEETIRRLSRAPDLRNVQEINKTGELKPGESLRGIAVFGTFHREWDVATVTVAGLEPYARECRVRKYGDAGFTLFHRAYAAHNQSVLAKAGADATFQDVHAIVRHNVVWKMQFHREGDEFAPQIDRIYLDAEG